MLVTFYILTLQFFNQISILGSSDFELNWFDFETRMRKLVYELLQPTVQRSHEDREILYNSKKSLMNHQQRLEEIEYSLFKSTEKTTVFDQIYMKMAEMEQDRKSDQAKTDHHLEGFMNIINEVKFHTKNVCTAQDQQQIINSKFREELDHVSKNIAETKETFISRSQKDFNKLNKNLEQLSRKASQIQVHQDTLDLMTNAFESRLDSLKALLEQYKSEYEQIQFDIQKFNSTKLTQNEFEEKYHHIMDKFDQVMKSLDMKDNQISTIENFIEKYVPIRVQSQISEILNEVITGKQKEVLEEIEKRKFDELHQILLLDNGMADLIQQIKNMNADLGFIEEAQNEDSIEQELKVINDDQQEDKSNKSFFSRQGPEIQIALLSPHSTLSGSKKILSKLHVAQILQNERRRQSAINFLQQQIAFLIQQNNLMNGEDEKMSQRTDNIGFNSSKITGATQEQFEDLQKQIRQIKVEHQIQNLLKKNTYQAEQMGDKIKEQLDKTQLEIKKEINETREYVNQLHQDLDILNKKRKGDVHKILKQVVDENLRSDEIKKMFTRYEASIENLAKVVSCIVEFNSLRNLRNTEFASSNLQPTIQKPFPSSIVIDQNICDPGQKKVNFNITADKQRLNSNENLPQPERDTSYFELKQLPSTSHQTSRNLSSNDTVGYLNKHRLQKLAPVNRSINQKINDIKSFFEESATVRTFDFQKRVRHPNQRLVHSFHDTQSKTTYEESSTHTYNYRNRRLSQQDVKQMLDILIQKCQEIILANNYPFKEKNLTTSKIFKDLYDYHFMHLNKGETQLPMSSGDDNSKMMHFNTSNSYDESHMKSILNIQELAGNSSPDGGVTTHASQTFMSGKFSHNNTTINNAGGNFGVRVFLDTNQSGLKKQEMRALIKTSDQRRDTKIQAESTLNSQRL
ncbi:UNKNOWN [Stylonychia lemnae]|uniref:Uncharacterized protein n=1 Tax=Stylonychia lemnae TaxID=5949 RepID=A0A078A5I4_STYLE|nr:UNKNOWN [Stylonychia lemnae]|eukprot:CDW77434.1 UNKNOWN [Stylonychia lemnae]